MHTLGKSFEEGEVFLVCTSGFFWHKLCDAEVDRLTGIARHIFHTGQVLIGLEASRNGSMGIERARGRVGQNVRRRMLKGKRRGA